MPKNYTPPRNEFGIIETRRQTSYLELVMLGLTNQQIADRLCVTYKAAKAMMGVLFKHWGVKDRQKLILKVASLRGVARPQKATVLTPAAIRIKAGGNKNGNE